MLFTFKHVLNVESVTTCAPLARVFETYARLYFLGQCEPNLLHLIMSYKKTKRKSS